MSVSTSQADQNDQNSSEPNNVRLPRKLRRQQLLISALRVFSSQGYHVTTMNHIASAADVTKPVLYQHFKSKQDLYFAVLDHQIESLIEHLVLPLKNIGANREKVRGMLGAFFEFTRTNPQGYRLIFESDLQNDVMVVERIERLYDVIAENIAAILGPNAGLSPHQAILISRTLTGMAISSTKYVMQTGGTAEELIEAEQLTFELAWGGVYNLGDDWEKDLVQPKAS